MEKVRSDVLSQLEKLYNLPESNLKRFVSLLTQRRLNAIEHLPDKGSLIDQVWKQCAILVALLMKFPKVRKATSCMHVCPRASKWMTFLDKLATYNPSNPNMLHTELFQILLLELISREKACQPFWTPAYTVLSERLWSPTGTDSVASDLTSSNYSSPRQVGKSQWFKTTRTKATNKSLPTTFYPSFTFTHVGKWEDGATEKDEPKEVIKGMKLRIYPSQSQKKILDEWMHTSAYVYNKTVEATHQGDNINFISLRDKFVTSETKKHNETYIEMSAEIRGIQKSLADLRKQKVKIDKYNKKHKVPHVDDCQLTTQINELTTIIDKQKIGLRAAAANMKSAKNNGIFEWEQRTPKDVRSAAVKDVVSAYKSGFANLRVATVEWNVLFYHTSCNKVT
jgi:hypothetical protein